MPYVIETRHTHYHPAFGRDVSHIEHTTVATLDEARELACARVICTPDYASVAGFPTMEWVRTNTPGTIGPLPDGTVIEVRPDNTHNV